MLQPGGQPVHRVHAASLGDVGVGGPLVELLTPPPEMNAHRATLQVEADEAVAGRAIPLIVARAGGEDEAIATGAPIGGGTGAVDVAAQQEMALALQERFDRGAVELL